MKVFLSTSKNDGLDVTLLKKLITNNILYLDDNTVINNEDLIINLYGDTTLFIPCPSCNQKGYITEEMKIDKSRVEVTLTCEKCLGTGIMNPLYIISTNDQVYSDTIINKSIIDKVNTDMDKYKRIYDNCDQFIINPTDVYDILKFYLFLTWNKKNNEFKDIIVYNLNYEATFFINQINNMVDRGIISKDDKERIKIINNYHEFNELFGCKKIIKK